MLDPDPLQSDPEPVKAKPANKPRARRGSSRAPSGPKGRGKDWAKGLSRPDQKGKPFTGQWRLRILNQGPTTPNLT